MAQRIVAGNWKMHLQLGEAQELFASVTDSANAFPEDVKVLVIPPFPYIRPLFRELPRDTPIELGAQNCHPQNEGAFTGEVSPPMLASVGAKYCIVGHSERRRDFGEDEELVLEKSSSLLQNGLSPIICVGEDLEEREKGHHLEKVADQLRRTVLQLAPENAERCILAYEPIWAIGTGRTATPEQASEMHGRIRRVLEEGLGNKTAEQIPLLYGGSCKASNAGELFAQKDIDGGLIGGASLKAEEFRSIVHSASS